MVKSAVFIIPTEFVEAGNALGEAMGWGPGCYSVPLSPTGESPPTHFGCRADVGKEFLRLLENPPDEALKVLSVVQIDLSDSLDNMEHWLQVTKQAELTTITEIK